MSTFDTYSLAWGDAEVSLQTHQIGGFMSTVALGDRVSLREFDGETSLSSWAQSQSLADPLYSIIEAASLGQAYWLNETSLSRRFFVLGHFHGVFADWGSAFSLQGAEDLARRQRHLWTGHPCAPGLAAQLALAQQRNSAAERSKIAIANAIINAFEAWREEPARKLDPAPNSARGLGMFGLSFKGLELDGLSELDLFAAMSSMSAEWNVALQEVDTAISCPEPKTPAEAALFSVAESIFSWKRPSQPLGASSPAAIAELSEPKELAPPATAARALMLLRQGSWRLFEADALALSEDSAFLEQAKQDLAGLCLSRIGAAWACGAISRNPQLMLDSIILDGAPVPFGDWISSNMGLPSRLVEPLIRLGAPCSAQLLHLALLAKAHHGALLGVAQDVLPASAAGEIVLGSSLPKSAVSLGEASALSWALAAIPKLGAELMKSLARAAVEASCRYRSRGHFSCAQIFIQKNVPVEIPKGAPMEFLAFLAHAERSLLAESSTPAAELLRSPPRL